MPIGAARAGVVSGGDAIPDSVVMQYYATTWNQGDTTWVDDATSDGSQDMAVNGDPQADTLSDGKESVAWDPTDDYGEITLPSVLSGNSMTSFAVEFSLQYTQNGTGTHFGLIDNQGQEFRVVKDTNGSFSQENGTFLVELSDDPNNILRFSPSTNPNIDDGVRHDISISIDDATNNNATLIIDGTEVSITKTESSGPNSFSDWTHNMAISALNNDGSIQSYSDIDIGAMRWHDQPINSQTIGDY